MFKRSCEDPSRIYMCLPEIQPIFQKGDVSR